MDSNMKLYALSPFRIELYLSEVENILEGPETARWPALFSAWRALRPKPYLPAKVYSTHDRPLTDVSWYANGEWADIELDERPRMNDPRVQWLLGEVVLSAAVHEWTSRVKHWSFVLHSLAGEGDAPLDADDMRDLEWWRATLFREGSKVPRRISFLDSSEWYVYLPVDVVLAAAARERRGGFLQRSAERLTVNGDERGADISVELRRLSAFIELSAAEGTAIYAR
jgi:hypothetical protein